MIIIGEDEELVKYRKLEEVLRLCSTFLHSFLRPFSLPVSPPYPTLPTATLEGVVAKCLEKLMEMTMMRETSFFAPTSPGVFLYFFA